MTPIIFKNDLPLMIENQNVIGNKVATPLHTVAVSMFLPKRQLRIGIIKPDVSTYPPRIKREIIMAITTTIDNVEEDQIIEIDTGTGTIIEVEIVITGMKGDAMTDHLVTMIGNEKDLNIVAIITTAVVDVEMNHAPKEVSGLLLRDVKGTIALDLVTNH